MNKCATGHVLLNLPTSPVSKPPRARFEPKNTAANAFGSLLRIARPSHNLPTAYRGFCVWDVSQLEQEHNLGVAYGRSGRKPCLGRRGRPGR